MKYHSTLAPRFQIFFITKITNPVSKNPFFQLYVLKQNVENVPTDNIKTKRYT